jgi:hypothetical protein
MENTPVFIRGSISTRGPILLRAPAGLKGLPPCPPHNGKLADLELWYYVELLALSIPELHFFGASLWREPMSPILRGK